MLRGILAEEHTMSTQPIEPRVQVLEDDMSEAKRILRENAQQTARNSEAIARNSEAIARNSETIAALTEQVSGLSERMDGVTRQLELLTKAVVTLHGPIDKDYEEGPSGRPDDSPSK